MARTKTIYQKHEIAGLWRHQAAPAGHAKTKTGNFSYCGHSLFSYGTEIGRIIPASGRRPTAILLTQDDYSVTTSSHQWEARSICHGPHLFFIPGAPWGGHMLSKNPEGKGIHPDERKSIHTYMKGKERESMELASRASANRESHLNTSLWWGNQARTFKHIFPLLGRKPKIITFASLLRDTANSEVDDAHVRGLLEQFQKPIASQKWMGGKEAASFVDVVGMDIVRAGINCKHIRFHKYDSGKGIQISEVFYELVNNHPRELKMLLDLQKAFTE